LLQVLDHLGKLLDDSSTNNTQQDAPEQLQAPPAVQDSQPGPGPDVTAADELYSQLVQMGLLRR
jgi:hypothetical protein